MVWIQGGGCNIGQGNPKGHGLVYMKETYFIVERVEVYIYIPI